jgi:hypothetical protein
MILSRKCPPLGSEIRIEVLIPSPDRSGDDLLAQCVGKVTRVAEEIDCSAFGVQGIFDDDHLIRQVLR